MNYYNRRRNIFTLGDFHQHPNPTQQIKAQHNRRQNSDPFERDPFKIQSYNFRYAERPSYPLPNLGNNNHHRTHSTTHHAPSTSSTSSTNKRFETFFYNYDFAPSVHDKENPPANKFREFRRRKFLLDHQQQNPTAAGMYGQATTSRQTSTLQHHHNLYQQQQQLHPISNGRSASQTALETAAASAAAAANALNGCGRMRTKDNNGRHYQAFGSATDTTSSIATTPHLSSSQQKCSRQTSARSTGNREYLRALATAHIGAAGNNQQANYVGRGRCSSRSSLELGRQMRAEPFGGFNGGNGPPTSNTISQTYGNARGAGYRELSGSRASPWKYAAAPRLPLQTIHTASPNRVTATVEKTEGTCSGCQININIKGLDSSQLGDNVVIKIESDKNTPVKKNSRTEQFPAVVSALNNIYNGVGGYAQQQQRSGNDIAYAKLVEIKRNSEVNQNLDIKPKASAHKLPPPTLRDSTSANFVIDKRLSKFAMTSNTGEREQCKHMPRSSSHSRIPVTSSTTRAMGLTSSTTALRCTNSTENIKRNTRSASREHIAGSISKERMPSMVPWCLDTTVRHGFGSNDDAKSLHAQSSNLIKHMRPSYDATLNDVRQKRRQAVLAAYKPLPLSLQRGSMSPSTPSRKVGHIDGAGCGGRGTAAGMNTKWSEKKSAEAGAAAATVLNDNELKRRQSHHSLRSLKAASKGTLQSQPNSQLDLGTSPTIIMRRSRSCIRAEDIGPTTRHASDSQSRLSVKTTPLNVNINVFADKLKLLRV